MALSVPFKGALALAGTLATIAAAPLAIAPVSAAVITLNVEGCSSFQLSGSGGNQTLTCVTDNTPPPVGAPTGCTASASPSSLSSAGGAVTLNASCSSGTTANTAYTWTRNSSTFATGASASDTLPANTSASAVFYSYSVQACNGQACSNAAVATVSVAGSSSSPPPGQIACTGFNATRVIDLPWKSGRNVKTGDFGGFGGNDAIVLRLTVPAGLRSLAPGAIKMGEWGGGPVNRYAVLSTTPCDFNGRTRFVDYFTGTSIEVPLAIGSPAPVPGVWGASLQPGQVYYLNVRNTNDKGTPSCVGGTCNLFVEFNPFPVF